MFPEEYILDSEAERRLQFQLQKESSGEDSPVDATHSRDLDRAPTQKPLAGMGNGGDHDSTADMLLDRFTFEEMILDGQRYLCQIPHVAVSSDNNATTEADSGHGKRAEEENELARATDRGLELLQEMEGTCMYFVSGWWSYSFCYKKQVKQFHALPAGPGVPNYPPTEDPTTHSFVLGRFKHDEDEEDADNDAARRADTDVAQLQTKGASRYLVQNLGGGTRCDLTGAERKIEVQFHCHPQSTDRIGWIKELTTCSYLMVIYTPRLCHDVAFQLPQPEDIHTIECREVLAPEDASDFEALKAHLASQKLINSDTQEFLSVGGIQVGAMKFVGTEGKTIKKGRVATIGEEVVDIVAKREGGEVTRLSKAELKKFDLDPDKVDGFQKKIDELADGKDWKLEIVESNGERVLRALVDTEDEDEDTGELPIPKKAKEGDKAPEDTQNPSKEEPDGSKGSKETFKDEL